MLPDSWLYRICLRIGYLAGRFSLAVRTVLCTAKAGARDGWRLAADGPAASMSPGRSTGPASAGHTGHVPRQRMVLAGLMKLLADAAGGNEELTAKVLELARMPQYDLDEQEMQLLRQALGYHKVQR